MQVSRGYLPILYNAGYVMIIFYGIYGMVDIKMIRLLQNLANNLGYIFLIAFFVSNFPIFRKMFQKHKFSVKEVAILSLIFGGFGILGTYVGVEIHGAIANTRLIGVMSGGILYGPVVGSAAGLIAALHRLAIRGGRFTAVPCALSTLIGGLSSSYVYKKSNKHNRWLYGLFSGIIMESAEMLLILVLSKPLSQAIQVAKDIYLPMALTNGAGIAVLIMLIQNVFDEKEEIAAKQALLAIEIANKTLPYFREVNNDSFKKICTIIKESIGADAVAITDREKILAHVGVGSDHHAIGQKPLTPSTIRAIEEGVMISFNHPDETECRDEKCSLKSLIIAPLIYNNRSVGTLKIYYAYENAISFSNEKLAMGLSQLISTQLEISKVRKLQDLASMAEIKALQAQINPHFLFNTLNTISSLMRTDINKARNLIVNFSTYLRYNMESGENLVSIKKELEHVQAYVEIEKARFGKNLNVIYDIENGIDIKVPPLIIQPIVENSILHGILEGSGRGTVRITIKKAGEKGVLISVYDDGRGFPSEIIDMINSVEKKGRRVGLLNVHNRLKITYGEGLKIRNLEKGSVVSFTVYEAKE